MYTFVIRLPACGGLAGLVVAITLVSALAPERNAAAGEVVQADLALTELADNLTRPVVIANSNDGSGRVFVVEQPGVIRIFDTETQTLVGGNYLDISSIVDDGSLVDIGTGEQGLLGLAFHPEFSSNRKFYVYYTRDPGPGLDRSVLAMYQQNQSNANVADTPGTVLMEFEQNADNHNGGDLHFGVDGFLYISSGDGGGSGDVFNNAQNKNTLKGKILRIDVDGSPPPGGELCGLSPQYGIPAGNAFPGGGNGCDEILHMGLRNPWKFSFDAQTEAMYIGDVGQGLWEEIDTAPPGASGLNFGWPCWEGLHVYNNPPQGVTCPNPVDPIIEYSSGSGSGNCSVTGGYVYRGSSSSLFGNYVYADYCSDRIWLANRNSAGTWAATEWTAAASLLEAPTAFGQDENCELYVADIGAGGLNEGRLLRIDDTELIRRAGFEALRCQ
jgi:glucose/arabinose dehydrogenase